MHLLKSHSTLGRTPKYSPSPNFPLLFPLRFLLLRQKRNPSSSPHKVLMKSKVRFRIWSSSIDFFHKFSNFDVVSITSPWSVFFIYPLCWMNVKDKYILINIFPRTFNIRQTSSTFIFGWADNIFSVNFDWLLS